MSDKNHNRKIILKKAWTLSIIVSALFLMTLISMWYVIANRYSPSPDQVSSGHEVSQRVENFIKKQQASTFDNVPVFIKTGLFIQSFEFLNANTVRVSGYVWQIIPKQMLQGDISPGVVFPEANTGFEMNQIYDLNVADHKVLGWHFYGLSLQQNFNYSDYPFDVQSIWIRLWPKDFKKNIILTPDLTAYNSTATGEIFGLDNDIVKHGFSFKETYFTMPLIEYDTNFGIPENVISKKSLELDFHIVVGRHLINPFLIHLLPIIVIWCILFALTMVITNNDQFAAKVKFSTTQLFIALGGIIFSVLLISTNLRDQYIDQPILYIEYFYLITYIIIMLVAFDAYILSTKTDIHTIMRRNLLPKTLFWPLILGCIVILTALKFFIFQNAPA